MSKYLFEWHTDQYDKNIGRGWSGLGSGHSSKSDIHGHIPHLVLRGKEEPKWELYIGSRYDVKGEADKFDAIINLSGDSLYIHHGHFIPPMFDGLGKYNGGDERDNGWEREMVLDWPNYGIPNLQFQFWVDLAEALRKYPKTLMFCLGGHGRTGTATCLLLLACRSFTKADEAIIWLRKNYCHKVVEGKAQEKLVRDFAKWMERRDNK